MGFGITKWPGFLYLTSIPLKPRVWLFFLTLGILLLVKNNSRVKEKIYRGLYDKQSQE